MNAPIPRRRKGPPDAEMDPAAIPMASGAENAPRAPAGLPVTTPGEIAVIVALDAAYRKGFADALLLSLDQAEAVRRVLRVMRLRDFASAKFPNQSKRAKAMGLASLLLRPRTREELGLSAPLGFEALRKIL